MEEGFADGCEAPEGLGGAVEFVEGGAGIGIGGLVAEPGEEDVFGEDGGFGEGGKVLKSGEMIESGVGIVHFFDGIYRIYRMKMMKDEWRRTKGKGRRAKGVVGMAEGGIEKAV